MNLPESRPPRENHPKVVSKTPTPSRWRSIDPHDVRTPSHISTPRFSPQPLLQLDQTPTTISRPTAPSCRSVTPAATLPAESSSNAAAISTRRMSGARAGASSMSRVRSRPTSADLACAADEQGDTFRRRNRHGNELLNYFEATGVTWSSSSSSCT